MVGTAAGILFDHNADGIKTGTGWVSADDGFLVLDKNGNGVIDNGRELFGDNFIKANGQLAADGFDALRSLDSNANGKIDSGDAQFGRLKVWRDLNQSGELFTLSQLGIASINTGSTAKSQVLPNGNQIADLGTYTKTDGTTGSTVEVTGNLADINLGTDSFHRVFTDHLDTSAVANLPDMLGSGAVRDLREAASVNSALSATLGQLGSTTTHADLKAAVGVILQQWADGANFTDSFEAAEAQNKDLFFVPPGVSVLDAYNAHYNGLGLGLGVYGSITGGSAGAISATAEQTTNYAAIRAQQEHIERMLKTLEAFNGRIFVPIAQPEASTLSLIAASKPGGTDAGGNAIYAGPNPAIYNMEQGRYDLLVQSYNQLVESVYGALATQTRLKPLIDSIALAIDDGGIHLDFSAVKQQLQARIDANAINGIKDLYDFNKYVHLENTDWDGWNMFQSALSTLPSATQQSLLSELNAPLVTPSYNGTSGSDVAFATAGNDSLSGNGGNDALFGMGGNDYIYGGIGSDILNGGTGNDIIYAHTTSGSNSETTADQLTGGVGNDTLYGTAGANTYYFNQGDGTDWIDATGGYTTVTGAAVDKLVLGAGIAAEDITLSRSGNNLVVKFATAGDQITFTNWYSALSQRLVSVQFADGSTWSATDFLTIVGTSGADSIVGDYTAGVANNDNISGLDGNDYLYGMGGTDTLNGGAGSDVIYGYDTTGSNLATTADQLTGGVGNDSLFGTAGANTYYYNLGDGTDSVDATGGYTSVTGAAVDKLVLGAGIAAADITLSRSGNNLVVKFATAGDQITFTNWYSALSQLVGSIQFADGTVSKFFDLVGTTDNDFMMGITGADIMVGGLGNDIYFVDNAADQITEAASAGNDSVHSSVTHTLLTNVENLTLTGTSVINTIGNTLNNVIKGNDAANLLDGGLGNDMFIGGLGNDTFAGSAGADNFVFDTILNATANKDTITDFNVADDTMWLENAILSKFTAEGALAAGTFVSGAGAQALDTNDYLVYNTNTGTVSYDADGNGVGAQVDIVTLTGIPALTAADFLII